MPRTRGECRHVPRPCPYERCRYHLSPAVGRESCALDEAARGPRHYSDIGRMFDRTHQWAIDECFLAEVKVRAWFAKQGITWGDLSPPIEGTEIAYEGSPVDDVLAEMGFTREESEALWSHLR